MATFYAPQSSNFQSLNIGEILARGQRYRAGEQAMRRSQAEEDQAAQIRPLETLGRQLALRGQLLGSVETPEDYAAILPTIQAAGLPMTDLPEDRRSTASQTFRRPEVPATSQARAAWMPDFGAPMAPAALPAGNMNEPGIAPEEIATTVQRRAQAGLPLKEQSRMRDADLRLAAQADELERRKSKDQYLRDYAEKNFELRRQGLDAATADRETRTYLAKLGYGLDVQRFDLTKKESEKSAALGPKFTADQSNSAIYGRRIEQSIGDMDRVVSSGYNPSGFVQSAKVKALVTGTTGAELVASPEEKQLAQAYRNAINAILRRESGAAIAASEFANAQQQYFPSVNDDPATLAQKRRNLNQALTGFKTAAGGAWDATPLVGGQSAEPAKADASGIPTVSSQAAYDALPPGSQYKAPNGQILTKKAR